MWESSKSRLLDTCKGGRSSEWTKARQVTILADQGIIPHYPRKKIEQVWWGESEPTAVLWLPEKPLVTNPGKSDEARSQVSGPGLGSARIMGGHTTTSSKDLRLNVAPEIRDGWKIMAMLLPALPHSLALSHLTAPRSQGSQTPGSTGGREVTGPVGALQALTFFFFSKLIKVIVLRILLKSGNILLIVMN